MLGWTAMRLGAWKSVALAALAVLPALAGCSYTFDGDALEVPLVGEPVPASTYPKLNIDGAPISDVYVFKGADGAQWAMMLVAQAAALLPPPFNTPARGVARLTALDGTERTEVISASQLLFGPRLIYMLELSPDGSPTRLRVRMPGDSGGHELMMPPGTPILISSNNDAAFVYLISKMDTTGYLIVRSDGSYQRRVQLPPGSDIAHLFDTFRLFFDPEGDLLFSRDGDGRVIAHSTRAESDVDLGITEPSLIFDSSKKALLACGPGGLKRIPVDGSAGTTLDPSPCQGDVLGNIGGTVVYRRDGGIYQLPELGGTPTSMLSQPFGQVLAVSSNLAMSSPIIYSRDAAVTYGSGIGDGWLGDWRFMNRGRRPSWSSDYTRVRWLENAARSDGSGDFKSAPIPGGEPLLLARNVRQYSEPMPGKLLAISNAAGKGAYNRLIVLSETERVAHWMVDSARQYTRIPGTSDVLVQIVNGQIGYDIIRVPIP